MKDIIWLGNTINVVRSYPLNVKREIGYNLDKIQRGLEPFDWKPMPSVGPGVKEVRIHDEKEYRILYVAKFEESIYVLHSFIKKTQKTPLKDIHIGKIKYTQILAERRRK